MANLKGLLAEKAANDTQWWISKFEPYMDETVIAAYIAARDA